MDNQQNQPKPAQSSNPIMWIILVIVIILLGIGVYYCISQDDISTVNTNAVAVTNTTVKENVNILSNTNAVVNTNTLYDTSSWQTYKNNDFGFQIKRPPQWLWQGSQSRGVITKFLPAQEEVLGVCQLEIYEGNANVSNISYQEGGSSTVIVDDLSVTRRNYIDDPNEINFFTATVTNGNTVIGFKAQIGAMLINVEDLTCEEYLIATLESFTFL